MKGMVMDDVQGSMERRGVARVWKEIVVVSIVMKGSR